MLGERKLNIHHAAGGRGLRDGAAIDEMACRDQLPVDQQTMRRGDEQVPRRHQMPKRAGRDPHRCQRRVRQHRPTRKTPAADPAQRLDTRKACHDGIADGERLNRHGTAGREDTGAAQKTQRAGACDAVSDTVVCDSMNDTGNDIAT